MQKQLAPTGQLTVHQGQLVYETPTKERVIVQDDRAHYLAQFLPMAIANQLNEAQMQMVRREHDAVLQSVSSQYHQMAMTVVSQQHEINKGLIGVLNKLADTEEAQQLIVRETVIYGEDFAGRIVFVLSLVLALCALSLTVCLVARFADGLASRPSTVDYQYR